MAWNLTSWPARPRGDSGGALFRGGAVVRLAREVELDTPVNRFILYSLRSLELRARGALSFNRRSAHR